VEAARRVQEARGSLNRSLGRDGLDSLPWTDDAGRLLASAMDRQGLTGRGWDRVRRTARTIADLEGAEVATGDHVAEALALRGEP
jgi:magnesium chelatase family protein